MKIYISLPITGRPEKVARQEAEILKTAMVQCGHEVVSPFDINQDKDNPQYEDYICTDLRAMLDCDAIVFCKGWEKSCGCNIEHDVAIRMIGHQKKDFHVFYEPDLKFLSWLTSAKPTCKR